MGFELVKIHSMHTIFFTGAMSKVIYSVPNKKKKKKAEGNLDSDFFKI